MEALSQNKAKRALSLFILVQVASCNIYYAQSSDHDDIGNHSCLLQQHCYELGYYLRSVSKYFTSNVKVYFTPGMHYLNKKLLIQNERNLSLLGIKSTDSLLGAQIMCNNFAGIILINTTNVTIRNLEVNNCKVDSKFLFYIPPRVQYYDMHIRPVTEASVIAINSTSICLCSIIIKGDAMTGLLIVNIQGRSYFESLHSTEISLYFVSMKADSIIYITDHKMSQKLCNTVLKF